MSFLARVVVVSPLLLAVPGFGNDEIDYCQLVIENQGLALSTPQAVSAREAILKSGFANHHALAKLEPGKSTTTSPFSVTSMLGMAINGAANDTLTEMRKGLVISRDTSLADFNQGYALLTQSLRNIRPGNTLSYGNIVIADNAFPLLATFKQDILQFFGAPAENRDFRDRDGLLARLNGYIEQHTDGMLRNVVKNPPTTAALINAGFFKGGWATLFDIRLTQENYDFRMSDGRTVKQVPMMFHSGETLLYYKGDGFQCVSLPYKNADFAMDVFVPNVEGKNPGEALQGMAKKLNAALYDQVIGSLRSKTLAAFGLPRWETGSRFEETFKTVLGRSMPSIFGQGADFSRMSDVSAHFSDVIHATLLQTNELGTKGAFVTFGGMRSVSIDPTVIADHPFMIVIRHVPTNLPIFITTELDPKGMPRPSDQEIIAAGGEVLPTRSARGMH